MTLKIFSPVSLMLIFGLNIYTTGCGSTKTLKPFSSDGCSLFPDRSMTNNEDWCECCVEHDKAYWRGGTDEERAQADSLFKVCILVKTQDEPLAEMMYLGVRLGGSPYFPTWYRWGYGWNYQRGYAPLTKEEKKIVQKLLDDYE
ncbi:MAG: hypothetical protein JW956_08700 [Calditrichaceae bacterium]|nr:hypothetical protein [Calditrichaceae bacterium]